MAKIMLVEDDNNLREIYGARLLAEGHEIVAAKDGEEALAMAVKEKPELIISDVMMPRISGFDMLDILRNAPETKNTKVIMMTALSQAEDKARADALGADRYLVKSQVTLEDVARVVHDVLEGEDSAADGVVASATGQSVENAATTEIPAVPETQLAPAPAITVADDSSPQATAATPVVDSNEVKSEDTPPAPTPEPLTSPETPEPVTAPAPEPAQPAVVPAPPANPVADTSSTIKVTVQNDPVVATPPPVATAAEPAPTPEPIKVELPAPLGSEPVETPAEPEIPEKVEEPDTSSLAGTSVDDVLAQEEEAAKGNSTPDATSLSAPPVEPVANGAQTPQVITPTEPKAEEPKIEEAKVEPTPEPAPSPLDDNGDAKKKVISPINDITKGPDLEGLLAAEQQKAAIAPPPTNTVITPENAAPVEPSPAVAVAEPIESEHTKIAL